MERIKDGFQRVIVFFRRRIPKGSHDEIDAIILGEGDFVNTRDDNRMPAFHGMERRNIVFDSGFRGIDR